MKRILIGAGLVIVVAFLLFRTCSNKEIKATAHLSFNDSLPEITTDKKLRPLALEIDKLYSKLKAKNGYNCCVLVAHDGEVMLQKGYGYADYKSKKIIDAHTSFQLASVSKPITATALLMLYDEGKLQLTDLVSKYIDGFPYEKITIAMLLSHRSGLPNYMHFCDQYVTDKKSRLTNNDDIINILIKNKPALQYKPDTHFMYSNTNYCLLASIIEKVSGKTFTEFLHERIFDVLDMKDTYVITETAIKNKQPNIAKAYTYGFAPITQDYLDGVLGDKGICSSVLDLYRFHLAMQNGLLLKKETLDLAYTPRSNEKKGVRNYGYGWRMKIEENDKVIYHNGWWKGFNNLFYRHLSDSTVVIILSNKLNKAIYKIDPLLTILNGAGGSFESEEDQPMVALKNSGNKEKSNP